MTKANGRHDQSAHVRIYMLVFGALMILTAVTVLVSYLHLPKIVGIPVGLAIATVKASLVAAFFMHLKWERKLIYGLLGLTVFFTIVLFALPITDSVKNQSRASAPPAADLEAHEAHP